MSDVREMAASVCGRKTRAGLSLAIEEELDDFFAGPVSEYVTKFLESGADDLSSRRLRIAGLTKKVNQSINPFGIGRVEANGKNPVPRAEIRRV